MSLFGDARGDEVPAEAADPFTRDERIDAALASARAERERRERQRAEQDAEQAVRRQEYLAAARAGTPRAGQPPAGTGVALAEAKVAREMAAQQAKCQEWERRAAAAAAAGKRPGGRGRPVPPEQYCRVRKAGEKLAAARAREAAAAEKAAQAAARDAVIVRNITDPGSRLMATRNGKQQCYNPQQVVSEDLLVIATELTDDPTDMAWFEPMMAQAEDAAALIAAHRPPAPAAAGGDAPPEPAAGIGQALADCGYLSRHNLTCPGPDRLIATGKRRDLEKTARHAAGQHDCAEDGEDSQDVITAMAARLATEDGITASDHGDAPSSWLFRPVPAWVFVPEESETPIALVVSPVPRLGRAALDALPGPDRHHGQQLHAGRRARAEGLVHVQRLGLARRVDPQPVRGHRLARRGRVVGRLRDLQPGVRHAARGQADRTFPKPGVLLGGRPDLVRRAVARGDEGHARVPVQAARRAGGVGEVDRVVRCCPPPRPSGWR